MRILALNPSSRFTNNMNRDLIWGGWCKGKRIAGAQFPPLPLLYVAGPLMEDGNQVDLLDAAAERIPIKNVQKRARDYDLVYLISATMSFNEDADSLLKLKEANSNLITVVFGTHATFKGQNALERPGVDIIVRMEAEFVIRDLVRALKGRDEGWKKVKGIGYKENGTCVINEPAPFIDDLDILPIPDRTMLPIDLEYYIPIVKRTPATTALTSRGCPWLCTFCTAPKYFGPKYRARSADNVLEELEYLTGLGYREVFFRDEVFTAIPKRVMDICEGILRRNMDVSWICNVKVGSVDKEMLMLMKRSGCHTIRIGVESGVQEILDNVRKGVSIQQARKTFRWANEIGLDTHAHMMIGMPGETHETIEQSFRFIDEIRPYTVSYTIMTPYPGSPIFEQISAEHPEIGDGSQFDVRVIHTQPAYNELFTDIPGEQLSRYVRKGYRRFYLRPSYLLKQFRRIDSWHTLRRIGFAGTQIFDFILRGD